MLFLKLFKILISIKKLLYRKKNSILMNICWFFDVLDKKVGGTKKAR